MAENEVALRFSEQLTDKLISYETALPKNFNRERFVQNCLTVMNEKPELAKINKAEVIQGLCKAAFLGLDFMNKECYLISYGNSVQFQTDYKGEKKFVKNYSIRPIKDIYAKVVRDGDFFEERILDGQPSVDFKPLPFNNAKIIGAFAVVLYVDGGMEYETMSTEDINSVRNNYSKASQSKAWKYSFDEMAKKTVLRRLCKHIETDFESVEARNAWDEAAGMEFTSTSNIQHEETVVDAFSDDVEEIKIKEIVDDIADAPMPEVFK
jgi:recombination protein RecT